MDITAHIFQLHNNHSSHNGSSHNPSNSSIPGGDDNRNSHGSSNQSVTVSILALVFFIIMCTVIGICFYDIRRKSFPVTSSSSNGNRSKNKVTQNLVKNKGGSRIPNYDSLGGDANVTESSHLLGGISREDIL